MPMDVLRVAKPYPASTHESRLLKKNKGIIDELHEMLFHYFDITSTLYRNDFDDRRVLKVETRWFLDINGYENLRRFATLIGSRHPVINGKLRLFLGEKHAWMSPPS